MLREKMFMGCNQWFTQTFQDMAFLGGFVFPLNINSQELGTTKKQKRKKKFVLKKPDLKQKYQTMGSICQN